MKIKQKIKIKGKNVPVYIEGEKPGVIATQIIEIEDPENVIEILGAMKAHEQMRDRVIELTEEKIEE